MAQGTKQQRRFGPGLAISLATILMVAACGSSSQVSTADLEGSWNLTRLTGSDGQQVSVPDTISPTISFQGSQVGGDSGCNNFSGSYTLDGSTIKFSPGMATTLKACDDPVTSVETAYLQALAAVDKVALDGDKLTLSTGGGDPQVEFTRA